ncbi:UNVERIFIED_CONTAM: hypothetical protein K2H54_036810, partial [Gekko kuhli]
MLTLPQAQFPVRGEQLPYCLREEVNNPLVGESPPPSLLDALRCYSRPLCNRQKREVGRDAQRNQNSLFPIRGHVGP